MAYLSGGPLMDLMAQSTSDKSEKKPDDNSRFTMVIKEQAN